MAGWRKVDRMYGVEFRPASIMAGREDPGVCSPEESSARCVMD